MVVKSPANYLLLLLILPQLASATVSCGVASSGVAFGIYDSFNPVDADSMGAVDITCSDIGGAGPLNVNVSIGISPSATSGSSVSRQMQQVGGSDRLNYNLFRDAARTQMWGDTPGLDDLTLPKLKVPNNGSVQTSVTIYGRMPAGQDVSVGSYSDTVVITVAP